MICSNILKKNELFIANRSDEAVLSRVDCVFDVNLSISTHPALHIFTFVKNR